MAKGLLIAPGAITLTGINLSWLISLLRNFLYILDKYCSKTTVYNNKPCIMCVNDDEGKAIVKSDQEGYWKKNGVWVFLKEDQKLF